MLSNRRPLDADAMPGSGEVTSSRGHVVVLDENEGSRIFVCSALASAGYESIGVATTLGLRKALRPERPAVVLCDVSPPLTYQQAVANVRGAKDVTEGLAPIVLSGSQS